MPQINRIRVNNVKYNFGTQVYDDFVMRFNCQNTIYDLANGGGKSLLMLLLMQNMLLTAHLMTSSLLRSFSDREAVIHVFILWLSGS